MVILYTVVTIQQVLFGFDSIVAGMETFLSVAKVGITIGSLALGIVIFLIMLKAWKIKRGLNELNGKKSKSNNYWKSSIIVFKDGRVKKDVSRPGWY